MKRISLIILAVAAIITGSVSCQKVNDLLIPADSRPPIPVILGHLS